MKALFFLTALLFTNCLLAQNENLNIEILAKDNKSLKDDFKALQLDNQKLRFDVLKLKDSLSFAYTAIDSLNIQIKEINNAMNETTTKISLKINSVEANSNNKISDIGKSLNRSTLYAIFGILVFVLLSAIFYILIRKRQNMDRISLIEKLNQTKSSIEGSLITEYSNQTELMNTQLEQIKQQKDVIQFSANFEIDHSLALKVASEINLIERNLKFMDSGTRGLKQLVRSIERLKDNLSANGYEVPDLLGKQFHSGMKVIVASSIPDENLEKGQEIISKILIPAVLYKDQMIQTAQIEVSVGA